MYDIGSTWQKVIFEKSFIFTDQITFQYNDSIRRDLLSLFKNLKGKSLVLLIHPLRVKSNLVDFDIA